MVVLVQDGEQEQELGDFFFFFEMNYECAVKKNLLETSAKRAYFIEIFLAKDL